MNAPHPAPKKILFIEDDENDVILVRHAFEKAGLRHQLGVVEDSRSAIKYLRDNSASLPDLIVLDLKLIGSSGFDVLQWTHSQAGLHQVPIIVFSSSWVEADVQRARALGAAEYMVKPGGFEGITDWCRELHTRWLSKT